MKYRTFGTRLRGQDLLGVVAMAAATLGTGCFQPDATPMGGGTATSALTACVSANETQGCSEGSSSATIGVVPTADSQTSSGDYDSGPQTEETSSNSSTEQSSWEASETSEKSSETSGDIGQTTGDLGQTTIAGGTFDEMESSASGAPVCDCFAEGVCLNDGQRSPSEPCRICVAETGALAAADEGSECATQSVCMAGACTEVRRVFATRAMFDVNAILRGEQVDSICDEAGRRVDENSAWLTWFSGGDVLSPAERFERFVGPYVTLQGTVIADSWTSLVSTDFSGNHLASAINVDERGEVILGPTVQGQEIPPVAWTGVEQDGTDAYDNCGDWTFVSTGRLVGTFGYLSATDAGWTFGGAQDCIESAHLYCFEQGTRP